MKDSSQINIHGLPLPQLLQELMEQGRWRRPTNIAVLKQMTESQSPEEFTFLDVEGMRRESYPAHLVEDKKLAKIYSLASSEESGEPIVSEEILDIDKSVFIAVNWSEDAICLDYRLSHENPRVIASVWRDGKHQKWKIIAPDFASFATKLGL